jgi:hypothetical protein
MFFSGMFPQDCDGRMPFYGWIVFLHPVRWGCVDTDNGVCQLSHCASASCLCTQCKVVAGSSPVRLFLMAFAANFWVCCCFAKLGSY